MPCARVAPTLHYPTPDTDILAELRAPRICTHVMRGVLSRESPSDEFVASGGTRTAVALCRRLVSIATADSGGHVASDLLREVRTLDSLIR